MFSTANFNKIISCFLFFHQHYLQEQIPVYDQFYHSSYTPTCSHTSAPRTAVPLPHLGWCYLLKSLLCPQQHRSPAFPAASSREFRDAHDGAKQDLRNTHKMASKNHPASATLCSDWADTHPAVEPVQNRIRLKACRAGQGEYAGMGAEDWKHIS